MADGAIGIVTLWTQTFRTSHAHVHMNVLLMWHDSPQYTLSRRWFKAAQLSTNNPQFFCTHISLTGTEPTADEWISLVHFQPALTPTCTSHQPHISSYRCMHWDV